MDHLPWTTVDQAQDIALPPAVKHCTHMISDALENQMPTIGVNVGQSQAEKPCQSRRRGNAVICCPCWPLQLKPGSFISPPGPRYNPGPTPAPPPLVGKVRRSGAFVMKTVLNAWKSRFKVRSPSPAALFRRPASLFPSFVQPASSFSPLFHGYSSFSDCPPGLSPPYAYFPRAAPM